MSSFKSPCFFRSAHDEPHIQLLHQEQVIAIPNCTMNKFGMCRYTEFQQLYAEKIKNCRLAEFCDDDSKISKEL